VLADAIKDAGINRSDLFIGTKIESQYLSPNDIPEQVEKSLTALETEYVDLLYVHWPAHAYDPERTFGAFNKLRDAGVTRFVGICNVNIDVFEKAVKHSPTPIDYAQIEFHPYLYQYDILEAVKRHGAEVVAESPLARGRILDDPTVERLAKNKNASPATVVLAWCLAHGTTPIPSSSTLEHVWENFRATEVDLTPTEVERLNDLDIGERVNNYDFAPWNR
jgi:2,5-diketo-D-gluconate reductase B